MTKFLMVAVIFFFAACKSAENTSTCIDESKINPDAVCIQVYKPVCGCDNKTYGNDCVAQNKGVTSWTEGECPENK